MFKKFITIVIFTIVLSVISLTNSSKVFAAACTWSGGVDNNWSSAGNWGAGCSGSGGIPGDGDDITIPSSATTVNDLSGLTLNSITFPGSPAFNVSGNAITINSFISAEWPGTFGLSFTLGGNVEISTANYPGDIDLNGFNLTFNPTVLPFGISGDISGSGDLIAVADIGDAYINGDLLNYSGDIIVGANSTLNIDGNITGSGSITTNGAGTVVISGANASYTGLLTVQAGTTLVNGTLASVNVTDGVLGGTGTVGSTIVYTGTLSPGNSPGVLTVDGDLTLSPDDTFLIEINGSAGINYDSVTVSGIATLDNATLSVDLNYVPTPGSAHVILNATGGVIGTFNGLPNGSSLMIGGYNYFITYDDTFVMLTQGDELLLVDFSANPATAYQGQPVVVNIEWGSTGPALTGTAELYEGSTLLGTLTNGVGTITLNNLSVGTHNLFTTYSGDDNFGGAYSGEITVTINPGLAPTGVDVPVSGIFTIMLVSIAAMVLFYFKGLNTVKAD